MDKTEVFLEECLKRGIKRVAIGVSDKRVPRSMAFPFGPQGSAFTLDSARLDGWPAIWDAATAAEVYAGYGNAAQAGVKMNGLESGYWFYRKGKGWKKG